MLRYTVFNNTFAVVGTNESEPYGNALVDLDYQGIIVIPEEYNGLPILEIGHNAFATAQGITHVLIYARIHRSSFLKAAMKGDIDTIQAKISNGEDISQTDENGLNAGEIAGIVISVIVFVAIIVFIVYCFYLITNMSNFIIRKFFYSS